MAQLKLVIIGNGMAAGRMVDELIARGKEAFSITVIGEERHGSYNRIMLSPVLAGDVTAPSIVQKDAQWYAHQAIEFKPGVRATKLNSTAKMVSCDNGEQVPYDHLIIATGARPASIPAKNQKIAGVMAFRTLDDVDTILACNASNQDEKAPLNAIVVGGGLLGLEAAYGLAIRGFNVTLVHRSDWLMNRQLDHTSGAMLKSVMEQKGVQFQLGTEVDAFLGENSVQGAKLNNGQTLPCDLAIIATGITPNAELGLEAKLAGNRAIQVDDYLATSDAAISAIGECVEHQGKTFGLVEPIWQHCMSLADRLVLDVATPYQDVPVATKLKVSGVQVFSAGDYLTTQGHHEYVYSDPARSIYRKLLLHNGCIVGIVLFGDVRDGQYFFELMQNKVSVSSVMPQLLLGKAFCEPLPEVNASGEPQVA